MRKDNSTITLKALLRSELLRQFGAPVVMETHGGLGRIFDRCYAGLSSGVVFEKDAEKANYLARQRPAWAVYECDCVAALAAGVGFHLPINVLDCDPYGEPWPVIDAFFAGHRGEWPGRLGIVVNDGLRQKIAINGGWDVASLQDAVGRYGAASMYGSYLEICREMVEEKARQHGYVLSLWAGYYCGHGDHMTHYAAVLKRSGCAGAEDGAAP